MTELTIKQVLRYVIKTHSVDESGDANLLEFMIERVAQMDDQAPATSDYSMMIDFLVWANGPDWKSVLDAVDPDSD